MEQTYKDHTITLSRDWKQFYVKGPMFEGEMQWFYSMSEVTDAIDARIVAAAKQKRTEEELALKALDDRGNEITVRGIHAGQGHLLGVEGRAVYPVNPKLRERLRRLDALRLEVLAIEGVVHPYGVATKRTYGRTAPEKYDALLKAFVDEFAAKTEKVKGLL